MQLTKIDIKISQIYIAILKYNPHGKDDFKRKWLDFDQKNKYTFIY